MRLKTFGRPHVVDDLGAEVALQPLPVAVLVYLAIGGPRDRQHLADLFWHNSKNGLNSLSTTLNRIRSEVPNGVWVRGNTLVGTDLSSDVVDLRSAVDSSDYGKVADLYQAPFLGNLKLRRQSAEFEEWTLETRTALASTVELALIQQGLVLYDDGNYREAAVAVEAAWEIATRDGFPSPDYFDAYHRILATAARPSAAAVRAVASDFGVNLSAVAPVQFEAVQTEPVVEVAGSVGDTGQRIQLFGRHDELEELTASVAAHRLTTLIGLGGSGKTRLATEFFGGFADDPDSKRRHWVNLRDVEDPDLVVAAIASSLGIRADDVGTLADQLAADQPTLLVLDNFEQVVAAADTVDELAQRSGELRVLVTSRVPLELASESVVRLDGLKTSDDQERSPAEQLFVSSARRAGASDEDLLTETAAIHEICSHVGGNPLALEIAGGWAQLLAPSEILEALAVGSDLLGTPLGGEGRSVDAVLMQSWSMLTESERETLMLVAAFPAGCLTTEALKVPGLSIGVIGRLAKYSLVSVHGGGRIALHPLIARHALIQLEQHPELFDRFHRVLGDWCEQFSSATQKGATTSSPVYSQAFGPELPNFASAWSWASKQQWWDLLDATLAPLRLFLAESGRVGEGRALFGAAVTDLRVDPTGPKHLLAQLLEALGRFHLVSGDIGSARAHLDEALSLSRAEDSNAHAQLLQTFGTLQLATGEVDEAAANFEAGIGLVDGAPSTLAASLRYDLAQAHHYRGDRDEAANAARAALQAGRSAGDHAVMTMSYLLLADIEVEAHPERAVVLLSEGWAIAQDASLDSLAIYFPLILGLAHLNLGQGALAEQHFSDGLAAANEIGRPQMACANHVGRAEARLLIGAVSEAIGDLRTGIRLALKADSGRYLMWAAVVCCRVAAGEHGPDEHIKELLCLVLHHPATDQEARDKATETLEALFDGLALEGLQPVSLDEIAERALELLLVS